jgi:hypothetical protein
MRNKNGKQNNFTGGIASTPKFEQNRQSPVQPQQRYVPNLPKSTSDIITQQFQPKLSINTSNQFDDSSSNASPVIIKVNFSF